ncbi:threonine ammonia-lyase [Pseudonocardia acaciae]|uniref:threonine ammonia-lyase n=1 Tax=Pseudonocardia acaciae TaxID=551276 RepID=UPI00048C7804|nr:pyridoxal-phosphate dependent enzyme [Pseudonocardia acaciae]
MDGVDIEDVRAAGRAIAGHLEPTPAWGSPALDEVTGARVVLKHEEVQPTGAFKVRGGLNLLAGMAPAERARGVVSASTGNHGQSLAYASGAFGARCRIVLPEPANPTKVRALRGWGAELVLHGETMEAASAHARALAERDGARFVHPADEPALIAGVGTLYLELLTAHPDLEYLFVPVGGGSGAASACLVAAAVAPGCRVIAVQSARSCAAHDSWRAGELLERPNRTALEGLAIGAGYATTQAVLRRHLSDFVLVDDDAVRAAQLLLLTHAHTLAEGAGAASLAGLLAVAPRLAGARVGIVITGGNASPAELAAVLAASPAEEPAA